MRRTCKGRAKLAAALEQAGLKVSAATAGSLLHELGYSLQLARKSPELVVHTDRSDYYGNIDAMAGEFLQRFLSVRSSDKKNELMGDYRKSGRPGQ